MMRCIRYLLLLFVSLLIFGFATPNHYPVNRDGLLLWVSYRNSGSVAALGTCREYSGNANHGTCVGDAYVNNQGAVFDGSGDRISTSNAVNITNDATTVFWAYRERNTSYPECVIMSNSFGGYAVYFKYKNMAIGKRGSTETSSSGDLYSDLQTWMQIAVTKSGSTVKFYRDGELLQSAGLSSTFTANTMSIGANPAGEAFQGKIDDLQVYSRVLSAGEIKQLYLKNKRN